VKCEAEAISFEILHGPSKDVAEMGQAPNNGGYISDLESN
jgi:hypothetical protein